MSYIFCSEVSQFNPLNTVTLGVLGVGAVGSVLWSMYIADLEAKKRRRIAYYSRKRSVDGEERPYERLRIVRISQQDSLLLV